MKKKKVSKTYVEWMLHIKSNYYSEPDDLDLGIAKDLEYNLFKRN
jgi:hypothetical protein|tara:strand:- start:406 stop:540 length:135 start_codon:yes stop_codon:yes gene_type:complete